MKNKRRDPRRLTPFEWQVVQECIIAAQVNDGRDVFEVFGTRGGDRTKSQAIAAAARVSDVIAERLMHKGEAP